MSEKTTPLKFKQDHSYSPNGVDVVHVKEGDVTTDCPEAIAKVFIKREEAAKATAAEVKKAEAAAAEDAGEEDGESEGGAVTTESVPAE